jgi:hypothetical protein
MLQFNATWRDGYSAYLFMQPLRLFLVARVSCMSGTKMAYNALRHRTRDPSDLEGFYYLRCKLFGSPALVAVLRAALQTKVEYYRPWQRS